MANGSDPRSGTADPWSVGQVSVGQRLIELEGTAAPERETVEGVGWGDRDEREWSVRERDR